MAGTPLGVPVFVVTHTVPQEWVYEESPFTFVTDGLESAVEQARAVAGDKDVGVIGANLVQQCLRAGSSTRYTSTWCPSFSEGVSGSSST